MSDKKVIAELEADNQKMKEEAKDIHSIKNGEGEYVLGQMYPPGSVGVKNMIDALEFYKEENEKRDGLINTLKEQNEKFKEWSRRVLVSKDVTSFTLDCMVDEGLLEIGSDGECVVALDGEEIVL